MHPSPYYSPNPNDNLNFNESLTPRDAAATDDRLNIPTLIVGTQPHSESTQAPLITDSKGYWENKLFQRERLPLFYSMDPMSYAVHHFSLQITQPFTPIFEISDKVNWVIPFGMRHIQYAANKNIDGDMAIHEFINIILAIRKAQSEKSQQNPPNLALLRGRMDIHPDVNTLIHSSSIRVRCIAATSSNDSERFYLYFFSFENEQYQNNNWTLAVRSAANAVLAIRERWGDSRDNLVFNFLRYGIPFHTFQRKYTATETPDKFTLPAFHSMPFANPDGEYTLADYQRYQDLREFFFDSPFGGIAGRSGGIIARLWREDTKEFKQRFQRIMAGPALYSSLGGYIVDCGADGIYYDDKLTDGMYAMISGQYTREDSECLP